MRISKWQSIIIIVISIISLYCILPTIIQPDNTSSIMQYLPNIKINLGLDLRGGVSILLESDIDTYKKEQLYTIKHNIVSGVKKNEELLRGSSISAVISGRNIILNVIPHNKSVDVVSYKSVTEKIRTICTNTVGTKYYEISHDENGKITVHLNNAFFAMNNNSIIERTIDVIRYRVDAAGVQEINIQKQGDDNILVQIPGAKDTREIKEMLAQTGSLKFHLVDTNISSEAISKHDIPLGIKLLQLAKPTTDSDVLPVYIQPLMYGEMIADAQPGTNMGKHIVHFKLTDAGTRKFAEITKNNIGKLLAIVLDNKVISAPMINEPILTGSGQISGAFDEQSAKDLAILLRSGALPAPVRIIEEKIIGPMLGQQTIDNGTTAIMIGCFAVVVIMISVYGVLGMMASIALFFNLIIILAVLSLMEATLTMPGLAGIALTLGMAVDANVLIYERMREERRKLQDFAKIIGSSYESAVRTILDSNITTIVAATVLYIFGGNAIKGFAVTLIVGIICSILTAIMFTRVFISWWCKLFGTHKITL